MPEAACDKIILAHLKEANKKLIVMYTVQGSEKLSEDLKKSSAQNTESTE
jgi:hypothetical protein